MSNVTQISHTVMDKNCILMLQVKLNDDLVRTPTYKYYSF